MCGKTIPRAVPGENYGRGTAEKSDRDVWNGPPEYGVATTGKAQWFSVEDFVLIQKTQIWLRRDFVTGWHVLFKSPVVFFVVFLCLINSYLISGEDIEKRGKKQHFCMRYIFDSPVWFCTTLRDWKKYLHFHHSVYLFSFFSLGNTRIIFSFSGLHSKIYFVVHFVSSAISRKFLYILCHFLGFFYILSYQKNNTRR